MAWKGYGTMKYVVILGDGMADEPIESLKNKTPLEWADTPAMDELAKASRIGMVRTIPEGMNPGSDTANLAVLGYDPRKYYTGRSPLEALSIGVDMKLTDIALRCNLVTLSEEETSYEERKIIDHSSDEISTRDAKILLEAVQKELETDSYKFYAGTSYRHLTIWDKGKVVDLKPPHDILGQVIGRFLPELSDLKEMMKKSYDILNNHPLNLERKAKGLHKANSIWFWGAGTRPSLDLFEEKYHKKGAMISAVDLLKGIGTGTGMKVIQVKGADGTLHTNYEGKARAAFKALIEDQYDFVYVHVEAPDEMGHQGSVSKKIEAIESIDRKVIKVLKELLDEYRTEYRMLILPDHPTPIKYKTHTSDPVPYMLYDSTQRFSNSWHYNEREAKISGNYIEKGYTLMNKLFALSFSEN